MSTRFALSIIICLSAGSHDAHSTAIHISCAHEVTGLQGVPINAARYAKLTLHLFWVILSYLADRCNATFGYCHNVSSVCLSVCNASVL